MSPATWQRASVRWCLIVPLAFGLYSLLLGQDRNWDLLNYHWYNGYAFWHDKLRTDFAPAGMQTYFNPTLDALYYRLFTELPAPAGGFLLGLLHGLNFILVLLIARRVLVDLPVEERNPVPLLLAAAGVLTANFLSALGNTMGDNLTALFCLGGFLLTLVAIEQPVHPRRRVLLFLCLAGIVIGLGVGLKLTNGIYAFALCSMLVISGSGLRSRLGSAFVFGVGVLIGFSITGGYWHYRMWEMWGNPFFPQFSSIFPNPLVPTVGVADTYFLPKNAAEYLLWPFLFSLDSSRVGQMPVRQVIWAVAYIVFLAWAVVGLVRCLRGREGVQSRRLSTCATTLVLFVALGYLFWMLLFSIYRYLVPIELLLPVLLFVLLRQLIPAPKARTVAFGIIAASTLVVVTGGATTWGHEGWVTPPIRVELPPLEQPGKMTVLIAVPDPPLVWIAAEFPASVAFTQVEPMFPRTGVYAQRIRALVEERGGPVYAVFDARHNSRIEQVRRLQGLASFLHLDRSAAACDRLTGLVDRLRLRAVVERADGPGTDRPCRLALRPRDRRDLAAENQVRSREIGERLAGHGFVLDTANCVTRQAYVGDGERPYQWCPVETRFR